MTDSFSYYCAVVDRVLDIAMLSPDELLEFFLSVVGQYEGDVSSLDGEKYRESIVKKLVPNWSDVKVEILKKASSSNEYVERIKIVEQVRRDLYLFVVDLYPDLSVQNLIYTVNLGKVKEDLGSILEGIYEKEDKEVDKVKITKLKAAPKEEPQPVVDPLDQLSKLEDILKKEVIGQREAIAAVVDALKLTATGISPFSSLFFIGPTGNGKTRLAKVLGENHFKGRFMKINCGEYSNPHEYAKLIGSPPGYIGHSDTSILAEKAEKSDSWVFLFDEIEKAHPKFYDFLLSLLDDGTVNDANGRELDFSKSLFIFTSNKGIKDQRIGDTRLGFGKEVIKYEESKSLMQDSLKTHFSPEFLNRIDKTIFFGTLSREDLIKVAKLELRGIAIRKTKELLTYVVDGGNSQEYGGRFLAKFIKNNISVLVADALLHKVRPKHGRLFTCRIRGGKPYLVEMEKRDEKTSITEGT